MEESCMKLAFVRETTEKICPLDNFVYETIVTITTIVSMKQLEKLYHGRYPSMKWLQLSPFKNYYNWKILPLPQLLSIVNMKNVIQLCRWNNCYNYQIVSM